MCVSVMGAKGGMRGWMQPMSSTSDPRPSTLDPEGCPHRVAAEPQLDRWGSGRGGRGAHPIEWPLAQSTGSPYRVMQAAAARHSGAVPAACGRRPLVVPGSPSGRSRPRPVPRPGLPDRRGMAPPTRLSVGGIISPSSIPSSVPSPSPHIEWVAWVESLGCWIGVMMMIQVNLAILRTPTPGAPPLLPRPWYEGARPGTRTRHGLSGRRVQAQDQWRPPVTPPPTCPVADPSRPGLRMAVPHRIITGAIRSLPRG